MINLKSEHIKRIIIDGSDICSNISIAFADGTIIIKQTQMPLFNDGGHRIGSFKTEPDPFESFTERPLPLIYACDNCDVLNFCDDEIYIPPCVLKKAGMPPDADLAISFCGGGIYITEDIGDYEDDEYE